MYNPKLYDMWSLGCILFIMLTGHMPYDESNVQQMLQNQIDRVLTYPHQVEGLISKPAKRLIRYKLIVYKVQFISFCVQCFMKTF